jgi:hypothetical protein
MSKLLISLLLLSAAVPLAAQRERPAPSSEPLRLPSGAVVVRPVAPTRSSVRPATSRGRQVTGPSTAVSATELAQVAAHVRSLAPTPGGGAGTFSVIADLTFDDPYTPQARLQGRALWLDGVHNDIPWTAVARQNECDDLVGYPGLTVFLLEAAPVGTYLLEVTYNSQDATLYAAQGFPTCDPSVAPLPVPEGGTFWRQVLIPVYRSTTAMTPISLWPRPVPGEYGGSLSIKGVRVLRLQ